VTAEGSADISPSPKPDPQRLSEAWSHPRAKRAAVIFLLVSLFLVLLRLSWGWYAHWQIHQIIAQAHRLREPVTVDDLAAQVGSAPSGAAAAFTRATVNLKLTSPRWAHPKSYLTLPAPDDVTGNKMLGDVARNAALLGQLRAARSLPTGSWGPPPVHPLKSALIMRFFGIYQLSDLLAWELCLDHVKGNDAEALETAQDWLKYAQVIDARSDIGGLRWSAIGIQRDALQALRAIAPCLRISQSSSNSSASRQQVQTIIKNLLDERAVREGGARPWLYLRIVALDEAERDEVDAHAGGALLGRLLQPAFDLRAARDARRSESFILAASASDWPKALSMLIPGQKEVEPWLQSAARVQIDYNRLDPSLVQEQFHVLTERRATAAVLAMRLYADDHDGQYPKSLSQLVPKYLPAVPLDPMAADGKPLAYQMPEGERATVFLYSVGNNGTDEGGPAAGIPVRDINEGLWMQVDAAFGIAASSPQIALPSTRQTQDHN